MNDREKSQRSGERADTAAAPVSRTQRKRAALDLQSVGARLVDLDPGDLARIPVPGELGDAIAAWKRIRSHEARRRQLQFIGKLMRRLDVAPILDALDQLDGQSAAERYRFHQLETWRDRLIGDDEALTEYLDAHPYVDRQMLRHQIGKARRAPDEARQKAEARALFRLLRDFEEAD